MSATELDAPSLATVNAMEEWLGSIRQIVASAPAEERLDRLSMLARGEPREWIRRGYISKPDLVDVLVEIGVDAGGDRDEVERKVGRALTPDEPAKPNGADVIQLPVAPIPSLNGVVVSDVDPNSIPDRPWQVAGLIPQFKPAILSADGDTGKTLLLLQLCVSTALGTHWIGREVKSGRALFVSAEEDSDELLRRLVWCAREHGATLADLKDVRIVDLLEEAGDTILAAPFKGDLLRPTPLWERVEALVADWRPTLLVLDPRADLFGGNEIVKNQVRQFMGMLRLLGKKYELTPVIADHPSQAGKSTESGESGNVGWRNAGRGFMYFKRLSEMKSDVDRRLLISRKFNYGPKREETIRLIWRDGVFRVEDEADAARDEASNHELHDLVLVDCVRRYDREGRPVGRKRCSDGTFRGRT